MLLLILAADALCSKNSLDFYHLTVDGVFRFDTTAVQPMPVRPSPEHHIIGIFGDLKINGTTDFAYTRNNIIYFDNQIAATYRGTGILHTSKIAGRRSHTAIMKLLAHYQTHV